MDISLFNFLWFGSLLIIGSQDYRWMIAALLAGLFLFRKENLWYLIQGVTKIVTIIITALILAFQVHLCPAAALVLLLVLCWFLT